MSLFAGSSFVLPLLKNLAKDQVRQRMQKAEPKIVAGMVSKGMERKPPHDCIRDAMFRLWKAVVSSGDIADALRDHFDDHVVPKVLAKLTEESTLAELVTMTREAVLAEL